MDLKSIFEVYGAPRTIRAGGNNFTLSAEYPVQALHVEERVKGWLMLSCSYEDAEGQKSSRPFGQARVRAGKVEVRFSGRGLAWKTARALKKLGSDYAPILEKVQAVLNEIDVEYSVVSARVERDRARLQELAALRNMTAKRPPADVQAEPAPERRVVALPAHDGKEAKLPRDKDLAYLKPADRVLALLEKHGPLTTKQLEEASGLKVPTLRAALNRLSRTEFKIESFTLQRNESGKLHPHWRLRRAQVPQS